MSRTYAQVYKDIWADDDFRSLEPGPQRLYLFLLSQPNLNYAGVLALSPRRWVSRSKGYSEKDLTADLAVLVERRYVVVDEDEEEVLVRSFIRNDGLWKNPKTMKSAKRDAQITGSRHLRQVLIEELKRLPLEELPANTRSGINRDVHDLIAHLTGGAAEGRPSGSAPVVTPSSGDSQGVATLSQGDGQGPGAGAGVGDESSPPYFGSVDHGQPGPSGPVAEDGGGVLIEFPKTPSEIKKPKPGSDEDPAWREFWENYPKKTAKVGARAAWAKAVTTTSPREIIAGVRRYAAEVRRAGRDKGMIKNPDGWLNGRRWEDEESGPPERGWGFDDIEERAPQEFNHG